MSIIADMTTLGALTDHLTSRFTIGDLTASETATRLGLYNFPNAEELKNLKELAVLLEFIWDKVGPFSILSGFRSQALQDALRSGAATAETAKMAVSKSYHCTGQAADITPTTMSLDEFFVKLWTLPEFKSKIGQVAYKKSQNSIHISTQTPTFPEPTPMKVMSDGSYVRLNETEKEQWLEAYPIKIARIGVPIVLAALTAFLAVKYLREHPELIRSMQGLRT